MKTDRVTPGQMFADTPIVNAKTQNAVLEAAEHFQQRKRFGSGKVQPPTARRDSNTVDVRNLTGSVLPAGSVVQLGAHLLGTDVRFDGDHFWLEGNTPSGDTPAARYAITKRVMATGVINTAFTTGTCCALVNVIDESHTRAKPVASATVLDSAETGPIEILSPVSETGEQLCHVRLGGDGLSKARVIEFELTATLATSDASATATVISFDQGTDPDPEAEGIVVFNPAAPETDVYQFAGESGARGAAYLITEGTDAGSYRILRLGTPASGDDSDCGCGDCDKWVWCHEAWVHRSGPNPESEPPEIEGRFDGEAIERCPCCGSSDTCDGFYECYFVGNYTGEDTGIADAISSGRQVTRIYLDSEDPNYSHPVYGGECPKRWRFDLDTYAVELSRWENEPGVYQWILDFPGYAMALSNEVGEGVGPDEVTYTWDEGYEPDNEFLLTITCCMPE